MRKVARVFGLEPNYFVEYRESVDMSTPVTPLDV
jgi:hypothetical protein